jgi:hypothetical protein
MAQPIVKPANIQRLTRLEKSSLTYASINNGKARVKLRMAIAVTTTFILASRLRAEP